LLYDCEDCSGELFREGVGRVTFLLSDVGPLWSVWFALLISRAMEDMEGQVMDSGQQMEGWRRRRRRSGDISSHQGTSANSLGTCTHG
jgi:hypothetical protein